MQTQVYSIAPQVGKPFVETYCVQSCGRGGSLCPSETRERKGQGTFQLPSADLGQKRGQKTERGSLGHAKPASTPESSSPKPGMVGVPARTPLR